MNSHALKLKVSIRILYDVSYQFVVFLHVYVCYFSMLSVLLFLKVQLVLTVDHSFIIVATFICVQLL